MAKKELVYTGEAQVLIEAGSHVDGETEYELQYSLDKENFSYELPTATEAGKHEVWNRVVDENDVPLLSVKKLTATIAPASAADLFDVTVEETDYTYDGTAKEPAVTVKGGYGDLKAETNGQGHRYGPGQLRRHEGS